MIGQFLLALVGYGGGLAFALFGAASLIQGVRDATNTATATRGGLRILIGYSAVIIAFALVAVTWVLTGW